MPQKRKDYVRFAMGQCAKKKSGSKSWPKPGKLWQGKPCAGSKKHERWWEGTLIFCLVYRRVIPRNIKLFTFKMPLGTVRQHVWKPAPYWGIEEKIIITEAVYEVQHGTGSGDWLASNFTHFTMLGDTLFTLAKRKIHPSWQGLTKLCNMN